MPWEYQLTLLSKAIGIHEAPTASGTVFLNCDRAEIVDALRKDVMPDADTMRSNACCWGE